MKRIHWVMACTTCLLALGAAETAGAMMLTEHGGGQLLEFPYYTANANQGTLITHVNTQDGHFNFAENPRLTASVEGFIFEGLPTIGFVAENLVNASVTAGVLANYSGIYRHKSTVKCVLSTDATKACH